MPIFCSAQGNTTCCCCLSYLKKESKLVHQFLAFIEIFVRNVLEDNGRIDDEFIDQLMSEGLDEDEIQQALTILYNLLINRRMARISPKNNQIRHITDEEARELGPEIAFRLTQLQYHQLLTPSDLDYLIYGYFETRSGYGEDEDFWNLLKAYRPEVGEYLEFLVSSDKKSGLLN